MFLTPNQILTCYSCRLMKYSSRQAVQITLAYSGSLVYAFISLVYWFHNIWFLHLPIQQLWSNYVAVLGFADKTMSDIDTYVFSLSLYSSFHNLQLGFAAVYSHVRLIPDSLNKLLSPREQGPLFPLCYNYFSHITQYSKTKWLEIIIVISYLSCFLCLNKAEFSQRIKDWGFVM